MGGMIMANARGIIMVCQMQQLPDNPQQRSQALLVPIPNLKPQTPTRQAPPNLKHEPQTSSLKHEPVKPGHRLRAFRISRVKGKTKHLKGQG